MVFILVGFKLSNSCSQMAFSLSLVLVVGVVLAMNVLMDR